MKWAGYNKTDLSRQGDRPDDGGSKYLWNVGKLLPDYSSQTEKWRGSSTQPPVTTTHSRTTVSKGERVNGGRLREMQDKNYTQSWKLTKTGI
jgi:hypothetical protein